MPIECRILEGRSEIFEECPKCDHKPFESFLRGMVQRRRYKWFFWGRWPYCAVICWNCKDIVGYEE